MSNSSSKNQQKKEEVMNYQSKIAELERILQGYNQSINQSKNNTPVDIAVVKIALEKLGATTEETLSQCSYEDLQDCGVPKLLARQIAAVFRATDKPATSTFVSTRNAERMTSEELLARYNPNDSGSAVYKRLAELSKNKAFIVFEEGHTVDIGTSSKLLHELTDGFGERYIGSINVGGVLKKIYKVGGKPDNFVAENPLYPGYALRPDGTCDQTNRNWSGVPLDVRQFVYLIARKCTLDHHSKHDLFDLAILGRSALSIRYSETELEFQSLQGQGQLPTLRVELGKQANKPAGLGNGRKVDFSNE